ncbi:MAG: CHAT domain-containing protein [Lewinellaceae bacterium]|nr:CHAT domain-containing protein [Saprospiraceae bacterium]MCB9337709.1 CHAT domain-containing protein [Lewinellaceae bacterium]
MRRAEEFCGVELDSAIFYLDKAIALADKSGNCTTAVRAMVQKADCASFNLRMDKVAESLRQAENALELAGEDENCDTEEIQLEIKSLWADYWYELGNFDLSLKNCRWIEDAILNRKKRGKAELTRLKFNYLFLASNYFKKNNYGEAVQNYYQSTYYEKRLAEESGAKPDYNYIHYFLAPVYQAKGEPDSARQSYFFYLNYLDSLYGQDPVKNGRRSAYVMTCLNLSSLYREQGKLDSAEWMLKKSLDLLFPGDPFLAKAYFQLGQTLLDKKKYREAARHFNESIKIQSGNTGSGEDYQIARSYIGLGDVFAAQRSWEEAFHQYQLAILSLSNGFDDAGILSNPTSELVFSQKDLLTALGKKSWALFQCYLNWPEQSQYLDAAWETALAAIDRVDSVRLDYSYDEDKQFLLNESYSVFAYAIQIAYHRGKPFYEQAFEMAERSKAVLLFEAIRSASAENSLRTYPDSFEQILQLRYTLQQNKVLIAREKDFQQRQQYFNNQQELERRYDHLTQRLELQHPEYYRLKHESKTIKVSLVKKDLPPHHALLEYFLHDTTAFIFIIDPAKEGLQIVKAAWNEDLANMATSITDDIFRRNDDAYERKALALFEHLLKPALGLTGADHLLIVPDGELWNVPFDALLTKAVPTNDKGRFKKYPYMLKEKTISYAFSATLQHRMAHPDQRPGGDFVVVAPAYRKIRQEQLVAMRAERGRMDTLWHNLDEASAIAKTCNGRLLAEGDATRSRFLQALDGARMLHFGGHAKADHDQPDFSFIALSNLGDTLAEPYRLYAHELYNHAHPLDLVVLSACETGTGQVWKGEGVISLARAFAHGGARSIVTTLWSINDGAARDIMALFYQYLADGMGKDDALHQAKLAYLNADGTDNERAHPFYWAAFTPIGDMAPVEFGLSWWKKGLAGAFLIGLLLWGAAFFILKSKS